MNEKQLEDRIKKYLFSKKIYFFKMHGSNFTVPGIPDLICCHNGLFIGIEVKKPGAKKTQSEQQKLHEEMIKESGGIYILADSIEDVMEVIK